MKIKLLNKIAACGTDEFGAGYEVGENVTGENAVMVRSAAMHDMEFGAELEAIARAGAGVNNIPLDRCAEQGIVVFNTPGANANGVKELAVAALLLSSRNIVDGINWANSLTEDVAKSVEKGKSKFAGCEIKGKTLGVIGLGAIGGLVANAARELGMKVVGCDPYMTVNAAWKLSRGVHSATNYEEIYKTADYITLHVPATPQTKNMINAETLAMMKDGVRIINLSRADLVNAEDMKAAIESGKVAKYVTDFPTEETVNCPGIITIPHLGASTEESEDNCAVMAAHELIDYLENGNITNSVNYPAVSMPRSGECRLVVLHKNQPEMLTKITSVLSSDGVNIENMASRSKGDYACALLDCANKATEAQLSDIAAIDGVVRVLVK
ncbi:MAG: 3-phosphoglycerate dehydrogenase family protein [Clostridia bacterium]|nr:3-phosphoglycerate dehydrogenase family protein [Clostridia bacterium]